MNVNTAPVTYSSIVQIGELVQKLEKETGDKYLKLHRGVMDVTHIDIDEIVKRIDFNSKSIQQYTGNDGSQNLIETIKGKFYLNDHYVMTVPGGMATLDLVINSLRDSTFFIPKYHWGSWNKILVTHGKDIKTFDDFDIKNAEVGNNPVMLCYPSNPTGFCPDFEDLKAFADKLKLREQTLILDLPYYYLFNDLSDKIHELFTDNVIILSSFSKSFGLSGLRIGFVATRNEELYNTLRIRSLYKYNSISTVSQEIINQLITSDSKVLQGYQKNTVQNIQQNIDYLQGRGFLFHQYTGRPVGPFAIVNKTFDELIKARISSVPLNKFTFNSTEEDLKNYSRISVAVDSNLFKRYFDKI